MKKEIINNIEILGLRCEEFNVLKNSDLANQIKEDLIDSIKDTDRLFLCSNEIGYKERAFAINFKDTILVLFNPAFRKRDRIYLNREFDTITNKEYFVPRFAEVECVYQNEKAELKAYKLNEGASVVYCQAMDRINGMLTSEYGLEVLPEFDTALKEEQEEVLYSYIQSISELGQILDKELTNDSETSKEWETAKFINAASRGDIEFEQPELSNRQKKKINKLSKQLAANANKLKFWNKLKKEK